MIESTIETFRTKNKASGVSFKDSGIEWVGKIPAHWETNKYKHLFFEKKKRTDPTLPCGSISFGSVVYKDDEKIPEATKASYQVLEPGEFLINPLNLNYDLISLRIALSDKTVVVSSGYIIIKDFGIIDRNYFKWLLHRFDVAFMKQLGAGVRQTIGFNDLAPCRLPVPPVAEQTRIANFLDEKTAKIDRAIAQKERLIALLKERRQILIHRAVTRGLNPNVKLKDSGVEWIGMVPEGWGVKRLKFLCHMTTGSRNTEDKIDEGIYPFFVRSQTPERINSYSFDGEAILTAGDGAGVGKVFHYINGKFDFHQRVYKFSNFNEVCGLYLFQYIQSHFHNVALLGTAKSTVDSLRLPLIQDFTVVYPASKSEQAEIIDYITSIDAMISKACYLEKREIERLAEYKTSLIDGAVRGEIII